MIDVLIIGRALEQPRVTFWGRKDLVDFPQRVRIAVAASHNCMIACGNTEADAPVVFGERPLAMGRSIF
jgi:hypothetical protein